MKFAGCAQRSWQHVTRSVSEGECSTRRAIPIPWKRSPSLTLRVTSRVPFSTSWITARIFCRTQFAVRERGFRTQSMIVVWSVRTELWMGLLAYNLVRHSLLQAAAAAAVSPRQLSFCAGMQFSATTWLTAATHPGTLQPLIDLRLKHMASHSVGHRPNRIEPRAIKRRPTSHDLLTQPRSTARAKLLTGCST